MMTRRELLKVAGTAGVGAWMAPLAGCANEQQQQKKQITGATFKYCLNTSTIEGQDLTLREYIDVAGEAGYDAIELWVEDVRKYLEEGNSAEDLKKHIEKNGLTVENAIGFAPWLAPGKEGKKAGFARMEKDMNMMGKIGCKRIAAPPASQTENLAKMEVDELDFFEAGERYRELIELGHQTGVAPHLEFWGVSNVLYHLGQALMIAAIANHPDVHILPDVYHLFRGGSGYEGLKMLGGNFIEFFHMNDFVDDIPREEQKDSDRVYPGDGAAPMNEILGALNDMGGTKILSVELFNPEYYKQDATKVATTALNKMKNLVSKVQ